LIGTTLKGENIDTVYADAKNLMNYGFDNFTKVKLYSEGDIIDSITINDGTSVPLLAGKDIYYTRKIGETDNLKKSISYEAPDNLNNKALIRGQILTKGKVFIDGEEIEEIDLASGISKEYNAKIALNDFYEKHTTAIFLLGGGVFILFIVSTMKRRKKLHERIRKSKLNKIINK